jgi:hypothetical protein
MTDELPEFKETTIRRYAKRIGIDPDLYLEFVKSQRDCIVRCEA